MANKSRTSVQAGSHARGPRSSGQSAGDRDSGLVAPDIAPQWTLGEALSNPAIIAVASATPLVIGLYSSWTSARRNPDLTLAVLRHVAPVNLISATWVPLACLVSLAVLWMAIRNGIRLSNPLFWVAAVTGAMTLPMLVLPAFLGLAICAICSGTTSQERPWVHRATSWFSTPASMILTAVFPFLTGVVATIVRELLINSGSLQRGNAADHAISMVGAALIATASGAFLVNRVGGSQRSAPLPLIGRFATFAAASFLPVITFLYSATGITWLPTEIVHSTEKSHEVIVGHVLGVDDTATTILLKDGLVQYIPNAQVGLREVCAMPVSIDEDASVVGVVEFALDRHRSEDLPAGCPASALNGPRGQSPRSAARQLQVPIAARLFRQYLTREAPLDNERES